MAGMQRAHGRDEDKGVGRGAAEPADGGDRANDFQGNNAAYVKIPRRASASATASGALCADLSRKFYMRSSRSSLRRGFTLVEIMIVVAIIALLAAIAVPNFLRARKRSQATRLLNDLRVLDYALDRYALETNRSQGDVAQYTDLVPYLKEGQLSNSGTDLFGGAYGPFTVDTAPKISDAAFAALSDVAAAEFWSPYYY